MNNAKKKYQKAMLDMLYNALLNKVDYEEITNMNINGRDYMNEKGVHKEEITIEITHEDKPINIDYLFDESKDITGWK